MVNIDLLSKICKTPGTSGFEQRIRNVIIEEIKPLVDEFYIDNMGSVIAIKKEKNLKE